MRRIETVVLEEWMRGGRDAASGCFPHEFLYRVLRSGTLNEHYQIDPKDSWLLAAARSATCRSSCRAGRTRRSATCTPRTASTATSRTCTRCAAAIEYMIALAELVHATTSPRAARSGSSRSAAASPATSRSASCRCCTRTSARRRAALGLLLPDQRFDDELRLVFGRRARTRRSPGASSASTRRSSSSSRTRPSSRR